MEERGIGTIVCHVVPSLDLVVARLGNSNPPGGRGSLFRRTYLEKIVEAIFANRVPEPAITH